jgi:DNA-binding transcriptional ArsR family regulator
MEIIPQPKLKDVPLDLILKALGDPVRISIVKQLLAAANQEKACGTFDYSVTKATFSHHMKILQEAGVIRKRQDGTKVMTSVRIEDLEKRCPGLLDMITSSK